MNIEPPFAYLCLVTWPNGTTGLLFPRPGNVPIAGDETSGKLDFLRACTDLARYASEAANYGEAWKLDGTTIRLIKFQALEVLDEHVHGD